MGEHKSRSTCQRRITARTAGWRQLICRVQNSCQSSHGSKWKSDHPNSDPSDPIHGMTRSQQTIIFRLRTGHNRLCQHMYKRFKVGDSEICPCGQAPQNTEHVLQTCSSHRQLRARTWPNHTPLEKKLYGTTEELALTVDYIVASGPTV